MSATAPLPAQPASPSYLQNALGDLLRAPFQRRTWAETLYVVVGLPLAVAGLVFVVMSLVLGLGLALTIVGLPVLALGGVAARRFIAVHRRLALVLLGERVVAPPPLVAGAGWFGWLQAALRDGVA